MQVRVWDRAVRAGHWTLVACMVWAWASAGRSEAQHQAAGLALAAVLAGRVLWGFAGSRYARFGQFVRGPGAVLGYLHDMLARREARHLGHNPAGGAMIVALLITLAAAAASGWWQTTDAGWGVEWVQSLHRCCAHGLLVLIGLHVGGVLLASWRHHENLVAAMIKGTKRAPGAADIA